MISVSLEQAIEILNEALNLDEFAVRSLINNRVKCNKNLADHVTIQAGISVENGFEVGMLGIINGIFGVHHDKCGYIGVVVEADGRISRFIKVNPNA